MPSHNEVVVETETLDHACGHSGTFTHYGKDPYRDARRKKFLARKCEACGGGKTESAKATAPKTDAKPKPSKPVKPAKTASTDPLAMLPPGAHVTLSNLDGKWLGMLSVTNANNFEAEGNHPSSVLAQLANQYIAAREAA